MASVHRRGKGWEVRWRNIDGRQRSRQCPTKRSASQLAREIEESKALGVEWQPRHSAEDPDVGSVMQDFLDDRARTCRQSTLDGLTTALRQFLAHLEAAHPHGKLRLDVLTKSALADFHQAVRSRASVRTANKYVQAVQGRRGLWNWIANDDRYCDIVPRPRVKKPPN